MWLVLAKISFEEGEDPSMLNYFFRERKYNNILKRDALKICVIENENCEPLSWKIHGVFIANEFYSFCEDARMECNFTFMTFWVVLHSFYPAKRWRSGPW